MDRQTKLGLGGCLFQFRSKSDCSRCKHDLLLYDPWECVKLLPDTFFQLIKFLSMTRHIEGDEKKFSILYTKHIRNQELWSWFLNWRYLHPTVQESSTLNMMMGPHNRRSTQGNAFFAACAWLLARDGVKQQCSNLHSGLYWEQCILQHQFMAMHGIFLEWWNTIKCFFQHFSCLLDEDITEILSIYVFLLVVDVATDRIAKPSHTSYRWRALT